MDFEQILSEVGNFGRYQKLRISLLSLIFLPVVSQVYMQVFTAGKTDYWCQSWRNEDCVNLNITTTDCEDLKKELAIPVSVDASSDSAVFMQCQKYNVSRLDLTVVINSQTVTSLEKVPCDEGWVFDKTTFPSSVVYDFQLVCENAYLPNIAQSGYFAGSLLGSLITGITSDVYGRQKAILLQLVASSLVCVAISFSQNFIMYMVLRFFTAISVHGITQVCYALGNELVTPSKRVAVMTILLVSGTFGYLVLAGMAKLIPSWQMLHLSMAIPFFVLLIVTYSLVPESPRWLFANKRYQDVEKILRKMAEGNGKELSEDFSTKVCDKTANVKTTAEVKGHMRDAFRSRIGILLGTTLSLIWMIMSLTFHGHNLNASSFGIDPYLTFCFFGVVEIPASLLAMFLTENVGRRNIAFSSLILGGICCCISSYIVSPIWRMLLAVAGKFFVTITYGTVNLWTIEMVPTSIRSRSMGILAMASRLGVIFSPMLLIFGDIWQGLPILVFGLMSFVAGLLCLFLPETTGLSLPVTMKDTEEMYKTRRISKTQKKDIKTDNNETGYCNEGMQQDETEHNP